jgi:oxygen-independent coproporphyrinogen III oxidase
LARRAARRERIEVEGAELREQGLGVYISVPFCRAKCTFCNFASGAFALERLEGYVERLCGEIRAARSYAEQPDAAGLELPEGVDSIYFGGGTPSLLTAAQLGKIFAALRGEFDVAEGAEVTLECAPGQLAAETLEAAVELGVNRVSLGVQSFVDAETRAVGRLHTAAMCVEEIARLRGVGGEAISVDLIAGLPGQTGASWERSVEAVIATGVPHASVYMLEVDEESRLGKELIGGGARYGAGVVPTDEAMTEFYARACEAFAGDGLRQYEISNFAREGHASRHNLKYWERAPYLGFGVDAHSMLRRRREAVRWANPEKLEAYGLPELDRERTVVDEDAGFEEAMFLGLRRTVGVSVMELEAEFGRARVDAVGDVMGALIAGGLMEREGDWVRLTARGRMVSNEVFGELMGVGV